jgi:hypothetical protein
MSNMNFDDFLRKEAKDRNAFKWNDLKDPAVGEWTIESTTYAWHKAGQSIVGNSYKDIDPTLTQNLVKYLLRDESFEGNLDKGILIIGGNGTGKTIYMKIFLMLLTYLHSKRTPSYSGKQIEANMRLPEDEQGRVDVQKALLSPTFFFDDLGEELDKVMVFGTYVELGKDVLTQRYEEFTSKGSLTFATSNLSMKMIEDKYGYRVGSRMHEMFNVFRREGNDLRKGVA